MTLALDTRTPAAPPWLAAFARRDRAIVGPVADFLCIYGAPPLALLLVWAFMLLPGATTATGVGATTAMLAFVVTAITSAHLAPVFVRSHLNPSIFAAHRWKLTLVPPALFLALTVSHWTFVVAGVVAVFWDVYHTAQQNFGLARIYDAKAGTAATASRTLDRVFSHVMYIGPIMAGASLAQHLNYLAPLKDVGLTVMTALPQAAEGNAALLRLVAIAVMATACVIYLMAHVRLARAGVAVSPHKVALMCATVIVQILAWGFSPPGVAFMVVNLFHAVQYFGLVWRQEGGKLPAHLGVAKGALARPLGLALVFVAPALYGLWETTTQHRWNVLTALFLSVSLLHFWMDGFIWSVRKKTV